MGIMLMLINIHKIKYALVKPFTFKFNNGLLLQDNFITALGEEKLLNPVGQQKEPPDYEELMRPRVTESTKIWY